MIAASRLTGRGNHGRWHHFVHRRRSRIDLQRDGSNAGSCLVQFANNGRGRIARRDSTSNDHEVGRTQEIGESRGFRDRVPSGNCLHQQDCCRSIKHMELVGARGKDCETARREPTRQYLTRFDRIVAMNGLRECVSEVLDLTCRHPELVIEHCRQPRGERSVLCGDLRFAALASPALSIQRQPAGQQGNSDSESCRNRGPRPPIDLARRPRHPALRETLEHPHA